MTVPTGGLVSSLRERKKKRLLPRFLTISTVILGLEGKKRVKTKAEKHGDDSIKEHLLVAFVHSLEGSLELRDL
jgi:hypothetical protein